MKSITLESGETATVLGTDGERITLSLPRAFPPGTPLNARHPEIGELHIKVRQCRRDGDGEPERFRAEGKLVNLSRAQRDQLLEHDASHGPQESS